MFMTGIKPTGTPHLGNYAGSLKTILEMSQKSEVFVCIADLHALTTVKDPKVLQQRTYEIFSCLDVFCENDNLIIYRQSDVEEVCLLSYFLSSHIGTGMIMRNHTFKQAQVDGVDLNFATTSYPVLMAADILLMGSTKIPIGKDQKQHLEIAQEIARKVNLQYGEQVFQIPEGFEVCETLIPGTDGRKMSKSYNNTIEMFCDEKVLLNKIKSVLTQTVSFGDPLPLDSALLQIVKPFSSNDEYRCLVESFSLGSKNGEKYGYGHAKNEVSDLINGFFMRENRREKYQNTLSNHQHIEKKLVLGKDAVREKSNKTISKIRKLIKGI